MRLRPGEIAVDLFAGGGGASEAILQALGHDPAVAVNHDRWAVGMHKVNHAATSHFCEDIFAVDPRAACKGRPVGLLHASPDCRDFSQAKGGQPRSKAIRSLPWAVLKWVGQVKPRIVTLENVKQIQNWTNLVAKRDKATGRVVTLDMVPLIDPATGSAVKRAGKAVMVNRVAGPGERVPVDRQFLVADKRTLGRTWRLFLNALRALGYEVEWYLLRASDYGAGTSRERLFMIARRDGGPLRRPVPSHGPGADQAPVVSAADSIDWSIPCPSIFHRGRQRWNKKAKKFEWVAKPLAEATCKRIVRGIRRYVLDSADPFIVPNNTNNTPRPVSEPMPTITTGGRNILVAPVLAPFITDTANGTSQRNMPADEPLRTQCAQVKGGHFALVAPVLVQASHGEGSGPTKRRGSGAHDPKAPLGTVHAGGGSFALAAATLVQTGYGERKGQSPRALDLNEPLGTVVGGAVKHAVVTAFLEQANGSGPHGKPARARGADEPVSSITASGSQQRLVTAHLVTMRHFAHGQSVNEPLGTVCSGTVHHGAVECTLAGAPAVLGADERTLRSRDDLNLPPDVEAGALRVSAFLIRYYGEGGQWGDLRDPMDTMTTRARLALVTVTIKGQPYVIVDIGLRMLKPHELFKAQGFPADYVIDHLADGTKLSETRQVRMVGNSVSPPPLIALLEANLDPAEPVEERLAA